MGLKEIIFDAGYNKKDFAKQADIPLSEFEEKLKSLDFYTMEVKNICEILNIPADRIKEVFFWTLSHTLPHFSLTLCDTILLR